MLIVYTCFHLLFSYYCCFWSCVPSRIMSNLYPLFCRWAVNVSLHVSMFFITFSSHHSLDISWSVVGLFSLQYLFAGHFFTILHTGKHGYDDLLWWSFPSWGSFPSAIYLYITYVLVLIIRSLFIWLLQLTCIDLPQIKVFYHLQMFLCLHVPLLSFKFLGQGF